MPKIILTRGIQGSGKSTWAKKWVEEDPARTKQDVSDYIDLYTCNYANPVKNVVVTDVAYLETIKKYLENYTNQK